MFIPRRIFKPAETTSKNGRKLLRIATQNCDLRRSVIPEALILAFLQFKFFLVFVLQIADVPNSPVYSNLGSGKNRELGRRQDSNI